MSRFSIYENKFKTTLFIILSNHIVHTCGYSVNFGAPIYYTKVLERSISIDDKGSLVEITTGAEHVMSIRAGKMKNVNIILFLCCLIKYIYPSIGKMSCLHTNISGSYKTLDNIGKDPHIRLEEDGSRNFVAVFCAFKKVMFL